MLAYTSGCVWLTIHALHGTFCIALQEASSPEAKHCEVSENENRKQELEHFTAVGEEGSGREEK